MKIIKILLVDDHAIVTEGIASILESEPDFKVVAKFASAQQALKYLETNVVDIIITDYSIPDINGRIFITTLKQKYPTVAVIVLSMHDDEDIILPLIQEGIDGYILKKYSHHDLLLAIHAVERGSQFFSKEVNLLLARKNNKQQATPLFTFREQEVLQLLAKGFTSKSIASKLNISDRTVETHRKNMLSKTNVANTVALIQYANINKLL